MALNPLTLAISAALFAVFPAAASAQSAGAPTPQNTQEAEQAAAPQIDQQNPVPTIQVSAREVIVDVLVTDSSGKPVHGLQEPDFTIKEDGSPEIIRSFYESTGAASQSKDKPAPLPAGEYTNSRPLPAGGPITIFLLDKLNGQTLNDFNGRITGNLRAMPANVPVGIFAPSASGLHTLQDITTDRDLLIRALNTPVNDRVRLDDWPREITTLRELNELAAYLSGFPGRKNLFWFALSTPVLLMRDGGYSWGLDPRSSDMSLVHRTMDTFEMLTAARIAVYPVMLTGLGPMFNMSHLELEKIAEDFGTANINDSMDPNAIAEAVRQTSNYYTFSYIPPKHAFDGHYHQISITLTSRASP